MTTTMTAPKPCGCGGAGKPGGCGCGCGGGALSAGQPVAGTVCDPCQEAAFVRPRFFAGQLLTEDDLEALLAYVIGKDRLRNARLFGAGVVCGFEVACDPCGGGHVVVHPGYALDCCGNDLLLACDRRLDVNALVAALRAASHGGHGCADPCAGEIERTPCDDVEPPGPVEEGGELPGPVDEAAVPGMVPGRVEAATRPAGKPAPPATYCLYVRYTEQLTEPVARYATGDDCDAATCEATRIAEGVTFELRCATPRPAKRDLFERLVDAVESLGQSDHPTADLQTVQYLADRLQVALPHLADAEVRPLGDAELQAARLRSHELAAILDAPPSARRLTELARFVAEVGGPMWRSREPARTDEDKKRTKRDRAAIGEAGEIDAALERALAAVTEGLAADARVPLLASAVERAYVEEVVELSKRALELRAHPETAAGADRLFQYGAAWGPRVEIAARASSQALVQRVADAVACGGDDADCTLAGDAHAAARALTVLAAAPAVELGALQTFLARLLDGLAVIMRYLVLRMCAAINPPCQPCDDPAVLLACFEVEQCRVTRLCNLTRSYVWSPTALQHWLPPARWLGQVIERACCDPQGLVRELPRGFELDDALTPSLVVETTPGQLAYATRFYRGHLHPQVMTTVLGAVGQMLGRQLSRGGGALPGVALKAGGR